MKQYFKILLVATFLVFANACIYAQPANVKSSRIETINGKQFYIHTVEKGQTLYGISKIYSISVDEILEYNESASTGLQKGMELKIIKKQPNTFVDSNNQNLGVSTNSKSSLGVKDSTILHIVKKGETLYSIANLYKVSVKDVKGWNSNVNDQISVDDKVVIYLKKSNEVKNSDIVQWINKGVDKEAEIIPIDTAKKEIPPLNVTKSFRGYYEVALMVPFMLSEVHDLDNVKTIKDLSEVKSLEFVQFYESFLTAFKEFEKNGVKVTLRVFDVSSDTNKLNKILNSVDFQNVDLIIGPFFTSTYKIASNWAKKNQVYIVNPFSQREDLFVDNPFAIKMASSKKSQSQKIAKYCNLLSSEANVVIVHNGSTEEKKMLINLKQSFALFAPKISIIDVLYSQKGISGVSEKIMEDRLNIVIALMSKEAVVTNFVRRLYELKRENVTLFAPDSWAEYDNIETDYFEYLHLHIFDDNFVDYSDELTIKFVEQFRESYHTEPELKKYGFHGYDICKYFVGALIKEGYSWPDKLQSYQPRLISSKIKLTRMDEKSGWENVDLQIYKIDQYRFVSVEK